MREYQGLCHRSLSGEIHKQGKYAFLLDHHPESSFIAWKRCSVVGRQNIWRQYVVRNVHYEHIDDVSPVVAFKPSWVDQQTLYSFYESRFRCTILVEMLTILLCFIIWADRMTFPCIRIMWRICSALAPHPTPFFARIVSTERSWSRQSNIVVQ